MKYKTKKDFLLIEKERCVREMVTLEIDIERLKILDPNEKIGERKLSPMSSEDLKAGEFLEQKQKDLDGYFQRVNIINELLDNL